MMLNLIAQSHGAALAEVSDQFIKDRIREPTDRQRMELRSRLGVSHPKLLAVVKTMEDNLESRWRDDIARMTTCPPASWNGCSEVSEYDTNPLLSQSETGAGAASSSQDIDVDPVGALACGFVSASHFSKCYRECYGRTPRAERAPRIAGSGLDCRQHAGKPGLAGRRQMQIKPDLGQEVGLGVANLGRGTPRIDTQHSAISPCTMAASEPA